MGVLTVIVAYVVQRVGSASREPEMAATETARTRAAAPARPARQRPPARGTRTSGRKSKSLTLVMTLGLVYSLLPLFWLLVNASKTEGNLFSTNGLWFGGHFALFDNIQADPDLQQRRSSSGGSATRCCTSCVGRGRRDSAGHARRLRPGEVRLPRQARRARAGARRRRGARHRAGRPDLPDVQQARPGQHAVGDHHPFAGQPLRPVPDVDLRAGRGPDRAARGGPGGRRAGSGGSSSPSR